MKGKWLQKAFFGGLLCYSGCGGLGSFLEEESEDPPSLWSISDSITQRARSLKKETQRTPQSSFEEGGPPSEYQSFLVDAMAMGEVALGMNAAQVRSVWGNPREVQFAGEPEQRNEKWIYVSTLSADFSSEFSRDQKVVYFEKGRVVGWEKE